MKDFLAHHLTLVCNRCEDRVSSSNCRRHFTKECRKLVCSSPLSAEGAVNGESVLDGPPLSLVASSALPLLTTHGRVVVDGRCIPAVTVGEPLQPLPCGLQWLLQRVLHSTALRAEQLQPLAAAFRAVAANFDGDFGSASQRLDRARVDGLQGDLSDANNELSDYGEQLANVRDELDTRMEAYFALRRQRDDLERQLQVSEAALTHVTRERGDQYEELAGLYEQVAENLGRIQQLENDNKQLLTASQQHVALSSTASSLSQQLKREQEEGAGLRSQLRAHQEDTARMVEERDDLLLQPQAPRNERRGRKRTYHTRGHTANLISVEE